MHLQTSGRNARSISWRISRLDSPYRSMIIPSGVLILRLNSHACSKILPCCDTLPGAFFFNDHVLYPFGGRWYLHLNLGSGRGSGVPAARQVAYELVEVGPFQLNAFHQNGASVHPLREVSALDPPNPSIAIGLTLTRPFCIRSFRRSAGTLR